MDATEKRRGCTGGECAGVRRHGQSCVLVAVSVVAHTLITNENYQWDVVGEVLHRLDGAAGSAR